MREPNINASIIAQQQGGVVRHYEFVLVSETAAVVGVPALIEDSDGALGLRVPRLADAQMKGCVLREASWRPVAVDHL